MFALCPINSPGFFICGDGDNRSDADRIGINITHTVGWLRQEENQYLTCPPEIAKELDQPLQELVGYSMGQYAMDYTPRLANPESTRR